VVHNRYQAMTQPEAQAKIDHYNREIDRLLKERKAFMDEMMPLFASAQVGDTIYDEISGRYLGIVKRLYRVYDDNLLYDTGMDIEYQFHQPGEPSILDNTSRQGIIWVATEAEHKRRQLEAARRLVAENV
jgi:hypothetical protein